MFYRLMIHSLILLLILISVLLIPTTASVPVRAQEEPYCFAETGYCIDGRIREYWEQNGGLSVFGLPTTDLHTERIEDRELQVQWFERNRLELHPENERPYDVLLGRLGVDVLERFNRDWTKFPTSPSQEDCLFFEETGQNICGEFLATWRADGLELDNVEGKTVSENLGLFGLPISPPQIEVIEGEEYTVQWFERARFELHPENEPPFNVLQGLLGNELRQLPERTPTSAPTSVPTSAPTSVPTSVPTSAPTPPATGLTGRIAFVSDRNEGNFDIYVMNADGSDIIRLTTDPATDSTPVWSPDGERIAFVSDRDDNKEIYVMNADGSQLTNITNHPDADEDPAWSPDGTRIAFRSNREGRALIYTMSTDGSNVTRISNNAQGEDYQPAWSPDGERIVFTTNRDTGNAEIYVMNSDGSGATNLSQNLATESDPEWSPDGERIAFQTQRDGKWQIYTMRATDGSEQTNLSNNSLNDQEPAWSPDGAFITFYSNRGGFDVYRMNADGTGVTNITNNAATIDWSPAWGR